MPRPTNAEIRSFLESIGLGSVDPSTFFGDGTLSEILRGAIDLGRLKPLISDEGNVTDFLLTPLATDTAFPLISPSPNAITVMSELTVQITTAGNIDEIRFDRLVGIVDHTIWRDFAGGPFPAGPYIGTPNVATQAWNSMSVGGRWYFFGADINNQSFPEQFVIRLISGVAAIKSVQVDFHFQVYTLEDFPAW